MKVLTLEKRFRHSSNIIVSLTLLFGIIFTNTAFYSVFYDDFSKKTDEISTIYRNHISFYISSMEESGKIVVQDTKVVDALKSEKYVNGISEILDGIASSDNDILGMTVYSLKNQIKYTSNRVSLPPSLDDLLQNNFKDKNLETGAWSFMNTEADSFVKTLVYKNFNSIPLYSYMISIKSEGETLGYMVMNTKLQNMYGTFRDKDTEYFKNLTIYIVDDKQNIYSKDNEHLKYDLKFQDLPYRQKGRIFSYEYLPKFEIGMFINVGLEKLYTDIIINFLITVFISLGCYLLYLLFLNEIVKSVTRPINRLRNKMKNIIDKLQR
ncbi:MAG: hypothetical protein RR957_01065 [Oscillospiraceae bacterium]